MIDLLKLVIKIHLILSFSMIFTLVFLGIQKLGFKRFFRELKDDNFWYIIIVFLTSPYKVVLIGVGQVGKKLAESINKIKEMTTKNEVNNG